MMRRVAHQTVPLTPAMQFLLMTGQPADERIRGWVTLAQAGMFGSPSVDQVWAAHRDTLIAVAAAHGFQPFRLTHRRPTGAAFEQWRAAFLAANEY